MRGVLDATNSSDRTDDDRERWQRFQRHVFLFFFFRVFVFPNKFLRTEEQKKKKKKDERLFVLLSECDE